MFIPACQPVRDRRTNRKFEKNQGPSKFQNFKGMPEQIIWILSYQIIWGVASNNETFDKAKKKCKY